MWAAGYGGSQTDDGNATLGSNKTPSRIAGGVVAANYRFSPFTLADFAVIGGGTNFSITNWEADDLTHWSCWLTNLVSIAAHCVAGEQQQSRK